MIEANVAGARPLSQFLRMAVMAGVESAVQIHIERGDDLNARDASGMTPLMLSAVRNKPAICKLLLSAGADHGLLDPSGRTALQIAIAAGAEATAAILDAARALLPSFPPSEMEVILGPDPASEPPPPAHPLAEAGTPAEPAAPSAVIEPDAAAEPPAQEAVPPLAPILDEVDDGEFDLSGWEVEEEPTRPEADLVVADSASAIQIAITAHVPIDSSAEWDDIEAYLPEVALPLARADDAERRARLRLLLLRALREGSVPALDVQAQSTNEDRSANPEAEAYLAMVINDLGAEADERVEYSSTHESFEVWIDPEETPDEEAALDEALGAIDRATSPRHEPLRIYQREFQRLRLLTAEEEVRLAKEMEAALDVALDALATWPEGIARVLATGADAIAGSRQLSSIWVGGEPDPEPASAEGLEAGEPTAEDSEDAAEDDSEPMSAEPADAGFANALRHLAALTQPEDATRASPQEIRQALAGLRLNRRFLLELIDAAHGSAPCPAFARAMAVFRLHRDRMTAANLKLAFFHAKKYLYSGEPLDDLAQEGNIGLLKAVDRYDWRRGFRFSTYAIWWIRQQIGRHVADKGRTIRVPVHIVEKLHRVERVSQAFEIASGRKPTLDELAERMEMPSRKVAAVLSIAPEPSSIDELTVDRMIAIEARDAHASPDPADVTGEIQLNQAVDNFISALSTKDRKEEQILRLRFGIGVPEALTLDEIGIRFEVTRERIRQIEAKAIRKLQHPSRLEPFARVAIGLQPKESQLAADGCSSNGGDDRGTRTPEVPPPIPKRQGAHRPNPEVTQSAGSSKPSALDRILGQASAMGISVFDGRQSTGTIWVKLLEPQDNAQRRLIRKLLEIGFTFSQGKGYWQ
ncbi:sigma-70 family RNA polymerase sigma factor [Ideonella sp. B7]|uniref:sigma-70 family RNA polymerase sigma factor n=1 Tax=Ideonella benzenivorans TaxID=2831643 RepID=UPI001CEDF76C|nr:sigma-70 family RNA polymerase sigma factor [Ideonella benzenivorans]MCA6218835.1 sigma-70 family RNA polymerase sigma factor [Ideonella benzenivorans]